VTLDPPLPDLQISFYQSLERLRSTHLLDALLKASSEADIHTVDRELGQFADTAALQRLAGWGLRGEILFAVPSVLRDNPHLLGYYRLLLGFSQKQFYGRAHGLGAFKSMEEKGTLSKAQKDRLAELARCLCISATHLVHSVDRLTQSKVHDLTLLTLGPQLRGGALNLLGQQATRRVFDLIAVLTQTAHVEVDQSTIQIRNAAGAPIRIFFASDPDIAIHEELPSGRSRPVIAIEIKGGKDVSNVHNRVGEAEKSHQKAKQNGFTECWTILGIADLDYERLRRESPTTDQFFVLDEITRGNSHTFDDFKEQLYSRIGLRDSF
jgi:hypothetical protein